jgi:poly(beta-D-mannuronate) lyase
MIAVAGTGSQVARRVWIHHNYFHDVSSLGTSGAEMIRFGLSALSQSTGAGLVEHNLFARCGGQNELISNRSCGNTYRYNTFLDSPNAQFTLRHGNECLVYGNIFRKTEGLRIFGDRHQVYSNYFEGNYIGISLGNGSVEVADGGALTGHDRPDNCVIAFNTFVDNRTHYQMSRRTPDGLGARDTIFANNILSGGSVAAKIEGPNAGAVWSGNILWDIPSPGSLPLEGYTNTDPLLAAGPDGIKRPQAGSPALEAAAGNFPIVAFDLEGRPRPEKKSVGADEISPAPGVARFLSPADVGPNAE